ncbi:MAG: sialate O-acetylesterase [Acutalibacteraceae bacterium]|nr:sialate O-acetylesterase [Acutalibacteraceae bacterium]
MIHSFLLIGQSNMAGRGFLNEAIEVDKTNIKILRNGRWQEMFRPINPDRSFSGVSLAESFAEKYAKTYDVEVGLIPCADGGTTLEQWEVGGLLFENAIFNAKLASRTSTIAGVLWHQGESDCAEDLYPLYKQKFEKIMDALRQELNLYDVPFLLGGLGDYLPKMIQDTTLKNYALVNEQLKLIAKNNSMTGYISAKGLTANPDNLHFNSKSLYEFGHRYFNEFERLRDKNKVFKEKLLDNKRTEMELL